GTQVGTIGGARYALAGIENGSQTVNDIDISTQDGAQAAIAILDRSLDQINEARGDLGAANNRLDFTVSNLMNVAENTNTARSRIMDADFAAETSMLSRAQVLQQASQAMLAQANALPQQVLRLLQ
ncbi:MAG TPA: flagellin, partial [Pseudomonadales bacterium]|nr:flagellin [Pseudomonadales bacterium]